MAEDSSSVELTALDITSCLEELDVVLEFLEQFGKDMLEGDNFQTTDDDKVNMELLTSENILKTKGLLYLTSIIRLPWY